MFNIIKDKLAELFAKIKEWFKAEAPKSPEPSQKDSEVTTVSCGQGIDITTKEPSAELDLFIKATDVSEEIGFNFMVNSTIIELAMLVNARSEKCCRDESFKFDVNTHEVPDNASITFLDSEFKDATGTSNLSTKFKLDDHVELYKAVLALFLYNKSSDPSLDILREEEKAFIKEYVLTNTDS